MEDYDIYKAGKEYAEDMIKGAKVARANGINLTKFKVEIKKRLTTINDEDQWTFDYQSYLSAISNGIYESPTDWGKEYYFDRWRA